MVTLCWLAWGFFHASRLRLEVPGIDWRGAFVYAMPDALLWILLTPIPFLLARRFPFGQSKNLVHGALHLTAAVAVAIAHSALDTLFNLLRGLAGIPTSPAAELFAHLLYYGFHSNVVLYLTLVGIAHYLARVESLREEKRRASELRAQLSEARLEALRLQLRPHFLFNVLNTISGLMEQDPKTSQRVVRQLGELLRMSLNARGTREISLRRELELTRAYLEIEQTRFQDRLTTRIDAGDSVQDCAVPPFILQPILENAVHHGLPPHGDGGRVEVNAAARNGQLELRVVDNGPGLRDDSESHHGIGLANTKARLAELYPGQHTFRLTSPPEGGVQVTLTLPRRSIGARFDPGFDPDTGEGAIE
ncbi:MAG: histidine kinase [Acidobacteriota bacterium]